MESICIKAKNREEWLNYRQNGIGSSEVSTILGLNPWETPYQLWRRKKGLDAPKTENEAMIMGHLLEDAVAQRWSIATGRELIKSSSGDWLYYRKDKEFMRASPDRIYWETGKPKNIYNKSVLECKTTQKQIDADDLPKHWFVQVQWLMYVIGLNKGSLAWISMGRDFGYKDIAFVPDFAEWMSEETERFWVDNIVGNVEPTATTVADVITKYARHTDGKIIEVTEDIAQTCAQLKEVREQISALESTKEDLEAKIKLGFGDAEAISYGGSTLATWKAAKDSTKFDYKTYQKEHSDLCTPYMQITPGSRRFILK